MAKSSWPVGVFVAMYGGTTAMRDVHRRREHPLEFIGMFDYMGRVRMFDYKGRDNRFGNIHTYKCNTKTFSRLLANAEFVPHTNVQFVSDTIAKLYIAPQGTARVCSVLWVRRHKIRELEDAVATLIMLEIGRASCRERV